MGRGPRKANQDGEGRQTVSCEYRRRKFLGLLVSGVGDVGARSAEAWEMMMPPARNVAR
jgi:hypothetical protein